jgi:hypothetical protein
MRQSKYWTSGYNPGSIGGSFAFSRTISLVMAFLLVFSLFWSGWGMETARADGADIILYVKMEGDDANGGTGWDDAFATLQKALDTADTSGGETYQIWIAEGTYIPTHTFPASSVCVERRPDPPNPPESWLCLRHEEQVEPRTAHFAMKNDVAIYGGFAGTEDPAIFSLADRDFANNETILSGDLGVDPVTLNPLKAYHVFYNTNLGLDSTAVLDGVTISGGFGVGHQGFGGGMYNDRSSPALTNVTFSGNYAETNGGGMANSYSNPTLTHVTFSGNRAKSGGGMYNSGGSSPILTHVTISDNEAFMNEGGGMSNNSGSSPVLTHVTISGNRASVGGGMYNSDSSPTLTNVTISGNRALDIFPGGGVGGGIYNFNGSLTLSHVTISGNWADYEAGGIYNNQSATTISNSIIWGNSATDEYRLNIAISPMLSTFPVISYSLIEYSNGSGDNWNAMVGSDGGNNIDADPKFIDYQPAIDDPTSNGDYRLRKDSPAINAGNSIDIPNGIITDLDGNSRVSGASVDMGAYEFQPPAAPANLDGTADDGKVALTWNAVSDADNYTVYKYEGTTAPADPDDWTEVATSVTEATYTVTGLTNGTIYAFAVKAVNPGGESDFSNVAVATPLTVPEAPMEVITSAAISVTAPVTGATPSTTASVGAVNFTAGAVTWRPAATTFAGNTQYTATVTLTADDDYVFASTLTTATINGNAATVTNNTGATVTLSYEFAATATETEITSAVISVTAPVTGATPSATAGVGAANFTAGDVIWSPAATTFAGNTQYTATVTLTADDDYVFASTLTTATINGNAATVTNNTGETVMLSYEFAATASPDGGTSPIGSGNDSLVVLVISTNGSITIPVGGSGEVNLDGEISIVIPDGASEREQHITIEKVLNTENLISEGETLASDIYELLKNFPETFDKPVTLTFVFDPSVAQGNQTFAIFYYDETEKKWIKVGGEVSGNTIRAEVDHFTKFAVFAIDEEASATDRNAIAFSDISEHWAEESIKQAVLDGIITGYPDGTFRPDGPVSRAEFTVMLAHALDLDGSGASLPFTDRVEIGAWAEEAVARAVLAGIVNGYGDGRFQPNAPITRSEMATMIARALQLPTVAIAQTDFTDDDRIPGWAKSAVESLRKLDIVIGRGDGKYVPDDKLTRAESVVALLRMLRSKGQD